MYLDDDAKMRVILRAHAEGNVPIVCIEDATTKRAYFLVRGSDGEALYVVTKHSTTEYDCTCIAGQHDKPCKHIGAALHWICTNIQVK